MTAIVGGTGSGKSTVAGLIPRFADANSGRVLVNGVDVRAWPLDALRAGIGFVPQKAVLFTGTVAANIRYGREDATDDEVRQAADVAQALEPEARHRREHFALARHGRGQDHVEGRQAVEAVGGRWVGGLSIIQGGGAELVHGRDTSRFAGVHRSTPVARWSPIT